MDLRLRTCGDTSYNQMAFPTLLEHRSLEAVESSSEYILLSVLHHLLEGQCNPDLRLLGCAVLAPRCECGRVRRPCRHVCEGLREACQPAFDAIDMAWPYFLDCSLYFAREEEGCYDPLEVLRGKWRPECGGSGRPVVSRCQSGGRASASFALNAGAQAGNASGRPGVSFAETPSRKLWCTGCVPVWCGQDSAWGLPGRKCLWPGLEDCM